MLLDREEGVAVVVECANGLEVIAAVREQELDVLFLDVQMPGATGIEVLESVGTEVGAVVLVTAFEQYAISAFEHSVIDYILKPVGEDRLQTAVARVRERLRERESAALADETLRHITLGLESAEENEPYLSRVLIRSTQKVTVVSLAEVEWIEADGDYLKLHTGKRVHLYRGTLNTLEERLDPREFVRIHRSTIVRVSRIQELEPYFHGDYLVTLTTGAQLRLSRTYRTKLQAALGDRL